MFRYVATILVAILLSVHLVPYLIYQLYAVSWGYELWKMNRSLS
jgi:hypothetical protein